MEFLAKSKRYGDNETIESHTLRVIDNCKQLKKIIQKRAYPEGFWTLAELACYLHDLGKYNDKFQTKINRNCSVIEGEIPHGFLSTAFIPDSVSDNDFYPLFYSIAYHHDRERNFSESLYSYTIENDIKNKLQYLTWLSENGGIVINSLFYKNYYSLMDKNSPSYLDLFARKNERQKQTNKQYILLKGILHKCDFTASAENNPEQPYCGNYSDHFAEGLKKKHIDNLHDYQQKVAEHFDKSIIFIASTGAGKTEYSMNWINGDKAFYLLGLRTAVNAMYERFTDMFSKDNVGLLHGESIYRLLDDSSGYSDYEEDGDIFNQYTKIRQLSMPITVATADQLVPSVFKFPGFEFYYFTASYSKIVIDEMQSFAPEAIASIVVFLKEIQRLGGKFLLMTATLPPFVIKEFDELEQSGTLVKQSFFSEKKRHVIKLVDGTLSCRIAEQIVDEGLKSGKKLLVISNTVAGTQNLADEYSQYNPQILHSRFIRRDRKEKEKDIFAETDYVNHPDQKDKPCLWISTQIVEASLDIDFDILLTENATIDALFQRFGRCWRKREYESSKPNIYIFKPEDERINNLIYDKDISKKTWDVLQTYDGLYISEEIKQSIIIEVFSDIEDTGYFQDYKNYKELLILGMRAGSKSKAAELFRDLNNNYTVIPEEVYSDNKNEIENLLIEIENRDLKAEDRLKLKEKLYNYTVPIQIIGKRKELIKDIYIDGKRMHKLDIRLLKGVTYTIEKGVEFIKDYKDMDQFIF